MSFAKWVNKRAILRVDSENKIFLKKWGRWHHLLTTYTIRCKVVLQLIVMIVELSLSSIVATLYEEWVFIRQNVSFPVQEHLKLFQLSGALARRLFCIPWYFVVPNFILFNCKLLNEGREGVKWELGLALLWTGKMGFTHWDWDLATGNGMNNYKMGMGFLFFSGLCSNILK